MKRKVTFHQEEYPKTNAGSWGTNMTIHFGLLQKLLRIGVWYFLFFLAIFFLYRVVFLLSYADNQVLKLENTTSILDAFLMGLRFDISAICYGFLPVALFWLVSLFVKTSFSDRFQRIFTKFCKYYLAFVLILFILTKIIDYYFYQFFQSRINILFFGIFNDDTSAVMNSVWKDYPIIKITILYALLLFAFLYFSKRIEHIAIFPKYQIKNPYKWAFLLVFPLFFLGLRGSVGVFPLRRDHTNVSNNAFINALCYNPLYALNFAKAELDDNAINPDIAAHLKSQGFDSQEQVRKLCLSNAVDSFEVSSLFARTSKNDFLEKNPPNVIFILMESMSNHYFKLHSSELNLLGDLANHLSDFYYFENALSSTDGTIGSLENLLVNSPKGILSQSPYFSVPFSASVAKPFQEKNYETTFVTGANPSWRNVDNFIKNQYFNTIEGSGHIKKIFPGAEEFSWGIHDGYLFDYLKQKLENKSDKPLFSFVLTVSNHTPYEVPKHYKTYPINIKGIEKSIRVELQMAYDNFYSHQYACSQLARFMAYIKSSKYAENTIVVVTGDHNIRQIFEYPQEDMFLKRSVPILFYIPKAYRPAYFDSKIIASHKDIFPTIFNLALSDQKYVYSGDNMFKQSNNHRFGVHNYNFIADSVGVISFENGVIYQKWKDNKGGKLTADDPNSDHSQFLMQRLRAFETMQTIHTYNDILKVTHKVSQ